MHRYAEVGNRDMKQINNRFQYAYLFPSKTLTSRIWSISLLLDLRKRKLTRNWTIKEKRHFHDGKMNIQRKPDYRGEVEVSYSAFSCVRSVSGLVWKLSQNAHLWLTPHSSKEFVALKELANLALSAPWSIQKTTSQNLSYWNFFIFSIYKWG